MSRRWREIAAAGHHGDPAAARAALADPDPDSRQLALGALARLGLLDQATLRAGLTDPEARVRRRAAQLAATRPGTDLLDALADPDPTVMEAAAWSCGEHEIVSEATLDRLIELAVTADDALVREAAVAALGAVGHQRALPAVLHGAADKPAIRRRAVLALAAFDGDQALSALRNALTDRDWQVRQAAEDVLRVIDG